MAPLSSHRFCLAIALSALTACSSSSNGGDASGSAATTGSTTTSSGSGGGTPTIACDSQPAKLALEGTWAAYGRLAVTLEGAPGGAITICPTDQVGESTMLLLITMKADTTDATKLTDITATLCSIELPVVTALVGDCNPQSDTLVSTQIIAPQTFLDALPEIKTTPVGGKLAGLTPGSGITLDRFTVTVGSSKPNPMMPKWDTSDSACTPITVGRSMACETTCVDDCAALVDNDMDGFPGVTVNVCGTTPDQTTGVTCNASAPSNPGTALQGRAFIDIQVDPQVSGTAPSSCQLTGNIDSHVIYDIIGADIYLENAQIGVTSAIKSLPSFQVDAMKSKFEMIRVDGKYGAPNWEIDPAQAKASCQTIIKHVNDF